jgi:hypothetical protein
VILVRHMGMLEHLARASTPELTDLLQKLLETKWVADPPADSRG